MKYLLILVIAVAITSCGGSGGETDSGNSAPGAAKLPTTLAEAEAQYTKFKGIGPIKTLSLDDQIDMDMASMGEEVFNSMCTACHKVEKKFTGPSPKGILERRTPEWVMNMILNPEQMLLEDPIAKLLYVEYNMSPMANQSLTEEQARAVLEYFRTL